MTDEEFEELRVEFIKSAVKKKIQTKEALEKLKRQFLQTKKAVISLSGPDLLKSYRQLIKSGDLIFNSAFQRLLVIKRMRTASGVTPVAVLTKPYPCPGRCVFCPTEVGMPKSYLYGEPAASRAAQCDFDPQRQVQSRLRTYKEIGQPSSKVELIVLGGSFTAYPESYQRHFIKACFEACNRKKSSSLKLAQKQNESAAHRLVGITVETRPDLITVETLKRLRGLGVTRMEIGVQSVFDSVLKKVHRGHTAADVARATKLLKDFGFKVCYHMMVNLPGSTPAKDLATFKKIFDDSRFRPDLLKIYPCLVLKTAELYHQFKIGKYKTYSEKRLIKLLADIKEIVPDYIRINRLGRDVPRNLVMAGYASSNIRELVQAEINHRGKKCRCLRCREIGQSDYSENVHLVIDEYEASGGREYFLQFLDNKNRLHGLLRLRLPAFWLEGKKAVSPELEGAAIIREVHVYGQALEVGSLAKSESQHRGLGRKLMAQAEEIVREKGLQRLAVISGVGVRDYYRRLGYNLQGTYLIKEMGTVSPLILSGCLVVNDKKEIYLLYRRKHSHYETPGGKIRAEEYPGREKPTLAQLKKAAKRELFEEVSGIKKIISMSYLDHVFFTIPDGRSAVAYKFLTRVEGILTPNEDIFDNQKSGYLPIGKLEDYPLSPDLKILWPKLKSIA